MARNPQRLAWTVLWLSFFTFCLTAVAVPWSISTYIARATSSHDVSLEILRGTVLLQEKGTKFEVNAEGNRASSNGKTIALEEGDSLRTVENSQAILWLFDGSNIQLWPNTGVTLEQLRRTRFNDDSSFLTLRQRSGHSRFEVAPPTTKSRQFEIKTPQASLQLREGSYSLDMDGDFVEVVTHNGSASVRSSAGAVELLKSERTRVRAGMAPIDPLPARYNLIYNGSFVDGLNGWQIANRGEEEPILGSATSETEDGRSVVRLRRTGATKHAETYIFQPLNKDITDFDTVKLGMDLKLINQSLSGGGIAGSEYPAMVRLKYKDIYGSEAMVVQGFYYQNTDNYPTSNGRLVPQNQWQTFQLDLLGPDARLQPRPSNLLWLEIAASGHNYESLVTNISLMAE
ncbi:MAG: FecR domain-containing protein [Chloroflexi bacterium]|nr:FecR domain-containing protein [Chloroflexota bacterium]